ncbi:hypothetical protein [Methylotenera mobilis]|uniref:Uncharacterized protein n=1 Tax=Methylotenera mobilis (strain JLW8 / ATCC BAA-1282 / DSM 17540) TaxID=583345 RepID=C6WSQ2_METML|nr:hypothetical protein [Methylotenera mobilis]ACT47144.1 hypothetical protein Mmol_0234 [Methylotenera mobilis JLW8]
MAGKGRKPRTLIDTMRTQLWAHQLKQLTHAKSFYELNEKFESFNTNYSSDYANGSTGVNSTTRQLIDQKLKTKYGAESIKASDFYHIGPTVQDEDGEIEFVRFWDALDGPIEGLWDILFWYDFSAELQHELGLAFKVKISLIIARLFNTTEPPSEWLQKDQPNFIAKAYRSGEINVDLRLLTAVIAVWRLANFMKDSVYLADYMMIGLLDKAAEDLLSPLAPKFTEIEKSKKPNKTTKPRKTKEYPSFYSNFIKHLINIDAPKVQKFNEVVDKFNGYIPSRPNLIYNENGRGAFELSKDNGFDYFKASTEGTRVSEYLI